MVQYIPTQQLTHNNEKVFFAFRTMSENYKRTGGKPDIPHKHDFYTVILVRNATGAHFIDFAEFKMNSRTAFFVSPGQVHQIVIENSDPEGDILMFNDEFLSQNYISEQFITNLGLFSCGTGTPPIDLPLDVVEKLSSLSLEIKEAFAGNSPFKFDSIAALLKLFLIECNKLAIHPIDENPQTIQSGRPIVSAFKDLLNKHYADWHKVSEYATAMNISPDYLNNVIKNSLGKTSKEMIFNRIILEAKRFGLHTELTNKEIAYQLGFDDPSHFSKFFKNETGESFSDFRMALDKKLLG